MTSPRPSRERRRRASFASLVAVAGVVAALVSQGTTAGFTAGLTGGKGTFASGSAILADTIGATTCTSSPSTITTNATNCTTNPVPTGTLPTTGTTSTTTTLNAPGTLMSSVKANDLSCGVQDVNDASTGNNTGIVHDTVTFGSSGPLTGSALAFTQSTGAYLSTINSAANPETFSVVAWFKFATGASGTIIGFSDDSIDSGESLSDRSLWLSGGRLVWGVAPAGTEDEVRSGTLTANTWHLAVASIGSTGQRLYIDGALAASTGGVTTAQSYTGYWHIGWGDETGWTNAPASAYWPGSLADVALVPSQLSAAQVTTLWGKATNATEQTAITALAPTAFWPLDDDGTAIYSGNIPGAGIPPFADATGSGNTGTGNGTFTTDGSGPLGGAGQVFDGSTSWMSSTTQFVDPHPLTITAWFKTTVGGTIIEYTNIQNGLTGNTTWDRHIWVDAAGHLVWGVWNGQDDQITSPGSYIDGAWHQVAASVGPTGMRLYVDGTLVATNTAVTVPEVSDGYWRLGDGNENNVWVDPPPNVLWKGSLSQVAVYPAQLTAAQITALTTPTDATTYQNAVLALTPTSYWELNNGPPATGCGAVDVTIQTTTGATVTCALPAGAGACPAPSSAATLDSWTAASLTGLTAGASQTVKLTLARGTVPLSLLGVHVSGTMSFSATGAGFTAVLNHSFGQVTL